MTADKKFKRLVRELSRRTGESYAAARHALLGERSEQPMGDPDSTRAQDLVECACSAWVPVSDDVLQDAAASEIDLIEADVECPACGQQRRVLIGRPPVRYAPTL